MKENKEIEKLRESAREIVRELGLLGDAFHEIGITVAERHLLIELSKLLYPDVKEIAMRLLLDKSTASRLIAKAVKKGFVEYCEDKSDKRRKCLELTEKGKNTLNAFEKIAQKQTNDAIAVLTPEEAQLVMRGVELYALGLRRSRLAEEFVVKRMTKQDEIPFLQTFKEQISQELIENVLRMARDKESILYIIQNNSKIYGVAGIKNPKDKKVIKIDYFLLTKEAERMDLKPIFFSSLKKEIGKISSSDLEEPV